MAVVQVPAGAVFTRRAWIPPARTQSNRSGWTGASRKLRLPGAGIWRVSAAVLPMAREADSWPWKAFIAALEGRANTFLMPYKCQHDLPALANVAEVGEGAEQGEDTCPIVGMPAGQLFLAGGRALTFLLPSGKRQMVLLTQNLVADGDGEGVAHFRGALREAPEAGEHVEARDPVCEMEMTSDDQGWDDDEGVYKIAFDAEESF